MDLKLSEFKHSLERKALHGQIRVQRAAIFILLLIVITLTFISPKPILQEVIVDCPSPDCPVCPVQDVLKCKAKLDFLEKSLNVLEIANKELKSKS